MFQCGYNANRTKKKLRSTKSFTMNVMIIRPIHHISKITHFSFLSFLILELLKNHDNHVISGSVCSHLDLHTSSTLINSILIIQDHASTY